jgi:hypothetical protein
MADSAEKRSRIRIVFEFLRRLLGKKPDAPPVDPYAYVPAPLRRGPRGCSGAAVAEIEDDSFRGYPPRG